MPFPHTHSHKQTHPPTHTHTHIPLTLSIPLSILNHTMTVYVQFVTELSKYRHTHAIKFTVGRRTVNEKDYGYH